MIDFIQNLQTEEHNFQETFETSKHGSERGLEKIPTSKDIDGIEVRLSNVKVIDNKSPKVFPFPGLATIYFINIIASDISTESVTLDINGFEKVDYGAKLALDRVLFSWKKSDNNSTAPSQIHVFSSLIKSKKPLRDVAKIMTDVKITTISKVLHQHYQGFLKRHQICQTSAHLYYKLQVLSEIFLAKLTINRCSHRCKVLLISTETLIR